MAHFDPFGAVTSSQVKVDDFLLPASQREAQHEVQPWFAVAEPRVQNVATDGLSWFHDDSSRNNAGVEEFLRALEYNTISGLGHYSTGGQDAAELGVLDDLVGGMYQKDNFLAASEIAREYEGFLLNQDVAAAADKDNRVICEGSVPRNSSSENQSPALSIGDNVAYIRSAESTTAAQFKSTGSVSKARICPPEMHGTRLNFQATAGYDIQENRNQIDSDPSAASQEQDKKSVQVTETCSCSPEWKWKCSGRRSKRSVNKCCVAKSTDQERSKDTEEELLTGAVLPQTRVPRKRQPVFADLKPDDLYTSSESEDESKKNKALGCKKTSGKRKHQVMWTTAEVSRLIEGVEQYGIGKWTDIKKLHSSSFAHRSPVDLRDKWRNLVKNSQDGKWKRWNQGVIYLSIYVLFPKSADMSMLFQ
ncbi:Telomere-binding protein 1 [Linum grandiflorum]